ncbi:hypothetical protein BT69DRAFT_1359044 [Atractiella rhizophila]|nr:hypothetical protein BT69DRAFT_1359044 [Atractiella rhizophila]
MPPRPPLQRNEACLTCRTRKVKCGAQKPRCHTCLRYAVSRGLDPSQVVCEYVQVSFGSGAKPGVGASPGARKDGQEEREKRAERIKSLEGKISELERLLEIQSYQILLAYNGGAADSLPFPPSQSSLPATTTIASSANQQSLSLSLAPIDLSPKSLTTSPILASPLSTFPDFASLDPPSKNINPVRRRAIASYS